jgi:hypothetical protein
MTATDAQVRILMREREKGRTQTQAAASANLKSRQTVARYEQDGHYPSERRVPRSYRTRPDPFEADWPSIERMLADAPELEAQAVMDWLCERHPERYQPGQVRTLQRRLADWRVRHREQIASLEQVRRPGEVLQTDGTWLTELGVTIGGAQFKHLLLHSVLPYSNWEWGRIAQSESLAALRLGLQSALVKLGAVPVWHQTDNSSAATYPLKGESAHERGFTPGYLQLLGHFGIKPVRTHVRSPDENGDVEAANGGLQRALEQHLLLRGSRAFPDLSSYEAFIFEVMTRRNQRRQNRLLEELAVMKPLRVAPLASYTELQVRVNKGSLIRVHHNSYSVPTGLIGHLVLVRVWEWQLEILFQGKVVETLPRLVGTQQEQINYRHVIGSLLCKPGGFRDYRYRDACFPSLIFRQAWEQLNTFYPPRQADLIYLRVLHLAARTLECSVAAILQALVQTTTPWDERAVEQALPPRQEAVPVVARGEVCLGDYDQLLTEVGHES